MTKAQKKLIVRCIWIAATREYFTAAEVKQLRELRKALKKK